MRTSTCSRGFGARHEVFFSRNPEIRAGTQLTVREIDLGPSCRAEAWPKSRYWP